MILPVATEPRNMNSEIFHIANFTRFWYLVQSTLLNSAMSSFEELFTFTEPELRPVEKKRKRKKRKVEPTSLKSADDTVAPKEDVVVDDAEIVEIQEDQPYAIAETGNDDMNDIAEFLGLTSSVDDADLTPVSEPTKVDRNTRMDRRRRGREESDEESIEEIDGGQDDEFLHSMSSFADSIQQSRETFTELLNGRNTIKELEISGVKFNYKNIKFRLNLKINEDDTESFELLFKSMTKVGKIVDKVMDLYGVQGSDLGIFVFECKLYLSTVNKFTNLFKFIKNFQTEINHDELIVNVSGILISEEESKKYTGKKDESIDDIGDDSSEVKVKNGDQEKVIYVDKLMTVEEFISLVKIKFGLPIGLKVELENVAVADYQKLINECGTQFQIRYDPHEYKSLSEHQNVLPDVEFEEKEQPQDGKTQGFNIFIIDKDKQKLKVNVKLNTRVQEIIDYYKLKKGINTPVKLVFDDEELCETDTISSTEIEEDFIVEIMQK